MSKLFKMKPQKKHSRLSPLDDNKETASIAKDKKTNSEARPDYEDLWIKEIKKKTQVSEPLMPDWEALIIGILEERSHERQTAMLIKARDKLIEETKRQTQQEIIKIIREESYACCADEVRNIIKRIEELSNDK